MSTQDNTGGPAFPHDDRAVYTERTGMTLRDYFAAQAMNGLIGSAESVAAIRKAAHNNGADIETVIATTSYIVADAMLRARQQPTV